MKNLIILISILTTNFAFGQSSGSGTVDLIIFFEKDILIENLELYYIEDYGSRFEYINYAIDVSKNSIIIKADHHWWAAPSFPTIVFSYPKNEKNFMFYLVSSYSPPYIRDEFNEKILFSFETPNVQISRINNNQRNFKVDYISKGYSLGFPKEINTMIKIESVE